MPNLIVSSDLDALLAKQTLAEAKTYLGVTANETAIQLNALDIETVAQNWIAEVARASAAEQANATDIATNATDIATNATAISTETTRATSAEGQLNTAIAAEISRAQTAEQANEADIATETTRALAAEALLAPIDDATFTGTTTIPSADITIADFNAGATNGGELSWNNQERTLDLVTGPNTAVQLGQELVLYVANRSGLTIPN